MPNDSVLFETNSDCGYLRQLVYSHSQNVLDPAQDYLFNARLARVMRERGVSDLRQLVQLLHTRRDPSLVCSVAEAMTINETSFFRDVRPFDLLRKELLPELIEKRRNARSLRIWSAACSTGQEAYSVAMLILEHFPQLASWNVQIEGTDVSNEVIQRCKGGRFHRIEINRGLPARNILRFFNHSGEDWEVKPELHRMCSFRQANLCAAQLPFRERFDVIFLRNVMLYFSHETRKSLLANIHRLLNPEGILFLGSSEQPADLSLWNSFISNGTCYHRPR